MQPSRPNASPEAEQESIVGHFFRYLEVGVVDLVVLDRLLRVTSKKVVNFFEKVHPQTKSRLDRKRSK